MKRGEAQGVGPSRELTHTPLGITRQEEGG